MTTRSRLGLILVLVVGLHGCSTVLNHVAQTVEIRLLEDGKPAAGVNLKLSRMPTSPGEANSCPDAYVVAVTDSNGAYDWNRVITNHRYRRTPGYRVDRLRLCVEAASGWEPLWQASLGRVGRTRILRIECNLVEPTGGSCNARYRPQFDEALFYPNLALGLLALLHFLDGRFADSRVRLFWAGWLYVLAVLLALGWFAEPYPAFTKPASIVLLGAALSLHIWLMREHWRFWRSPEAPSSSSAGRQPL